MSATEKMPDATKERIEAAFSSRCISLDIKYKTKKYYEEQAAFFIGAMIALDINFPYWIVCISAGREIIKPYKLP